MGYIEGETLIHLWMTWQCKDEIEVSPISLCNSLPVS